MEQKREINLNSSVKSSKEKNQEVLNFLIKDKLVDVYGDQVQDPKSEIISNLTQTELDNAHNNIALTSSTYFSLFKPNFKSRLITKLLVNVAWGEQEKVEQLLKTSPELMLEKTTFTDCSGRTFSNISAFEFVLWAWDTRYMVRMMLDCLPKNDAGFDLAEALKKQYDHHQKYGVTYTLDGETINEIHFDFSSYIKALRTHAKHFDDWDWSAREKQWFSVVGKAQRYLPAHVIQHYCDPDVPFYPLPEFKAEHLVRTRQFHNWVNDSDMTWSGITHSSDSVLGEHFGIVRSLSSVGASGIAPRSRGSCGDWSTDFLAIMTLYETRTLDYQAIPSSLASLFEKKQQMPNP